MPTFVVDLLSEKELLLHPEFLTLGAADDLYVNVTGDTMTGDLNVDAHLAAGSNSTTHTYDIMTVDEIFTDPTEDKTGLTFNLRLAGDPGSYNHWGLFGSVVTSGSITPNPTGIWTGIEGRFLLVNSGVTAPETRSLVANCQLYNDTITKHSGLYVKDPSTIVSAGTITTNNGIWVEAQAYGTTNRGIVLDGDGAGSDIVFGATQGSSIHDDGTDLSFVTTGGYRFSSGDLHVNRLIRRDTDTNTYLDFQNDKITIVAGGGKYVTCLGGATDLLTFNETGADIDVIIEGDTDVNLLYSDASTDRIGISTATPTVLFDIEGEGRSLDRFSAYSNVDVVKYAAMG